MSTPTPAAIREAFAAVGRAQPRADEIDALIAGLSSWGSLEALRSWATPFSGAPLIVQRIAHAYAAAMAEGADPAVYANRLRIEADQHDGWAVKADAEAAYRQRCAATWTSRGDPEMAAGYLSQEVVERRFAVHCREIATEKRATAAGLVAPVQAEAA